MRHDLDHTQRGGTVDRAAPSAVNASDYVFGLLPVSTSGSGKQVASL